MLGRNKMSKIIPLGTAFILGVGAGLVIQGESWSNFLTSYIPALATLVAAYYGAKFAFQFEENKEERALKKQNLVNANNCLFSMSRMANKLAVYQRDIINPFRNDPMRFIAINATSELEKESVKLDINSLYFILQTNDKNLLGEVVTEEERYRAAVDTINLRSEYHLKYIQPALESAGFISGNKYSLAQLRDMLGPLHYDTLVNATEQVIEYVDNTILSIKLVADSLKDSVKKQYPNETVLGFSLPNSQVKN
jgi:hypothetical protein